MVTKKEWLAQEVAKAVGAGKVVALETVDFNDPNRPKTCLEVDFPVIPINQIAAVESSSGAASKPIYQMSKWWARRPSSVFRSILIAAATKAPDDILQTSKLVWENYYSNLNKKGSFSALKVLDIFMGGGTTLVEGSRLGMQMIGNDLNPVAWFVVKQEFADVNLEEVKRLLADIEAEVKPQIMPYYYCDGPNGEKGTWTHLPANQVMPPDFDPLCIPREERRDYKYEGPEIIYTFWAKHGPCQVTGCGHRTPIMSSPVMAIKTLTVKHWERSCKSCGGKFHVEAHAARMAPDVPIYVAPSEYPFTVYEPGKGIVCPHCGHAEHVNLTKGKNKKIQLTLLVHPEWLAGSPKQDADGCPYGGAAQDDAESTARWNHERASKIRLLEVRGILPHEVTCPDTGITFRSDEGTVPKRSNFACGACGTVQDVMNTIKATQKSGQMTGYAIQGYAPERDNAGIPYGGRFFSPFKQEFARQYDAASVEWESRKNIDLVDFWPKSELPYGFMTAVANSDIRENYGFTHWWTMFNPRQLLVHALLLKAIKRVGDDKYEWKTREFVLGAFQQFLRFNCMFTVYHPNNDQATKHFANNNFHPRNTLLEVSVFSFVGDGRWVSAGEAIIKGAEWKSQPWELVPTSFLSAKGIDISGKTEKVFTNDLLRKENIQLSCSTSSDLQQLDTGSIDLVVTDPPFGGLVHYSELSDFFYVWLRLLLKEKYPQFFSNEFTPKSLEVSRPEEFHLQPLADPDRNVPAHPAPII